MLVPCEVGLLLLERKRLGWSWRSLIVPGGSRTVLALDILLSVTALYIVAQAAAALAMPLRAAILAAMGQWLPRWAVLDGLLMGVTPSILWLGLFLSGLVAPIVEELYFRAISATKDPRSRALGSRGQCRLPLDLSLLRSLELPLVLPGIPPACLLRST